MSRRTANRLAFVLPLLLILAGSLHAYFTLAT
jgi:hypothetical protein